MYRAGTFLRFIYACPHSGADKRSKEQIVATVSLSCYISVRKFLYFGENVCSACTKDINPRSPNINNAVV